MPLSRCPRCNKLFNKPENAKNAVCELCSEEEQSDYERVREVLDQYGNLSAIEISEKANIPLEVILRMCNQGWLETSEPSETIYCGRCGAPAISKTKRLCEACLIELQRECLKAMRDLKMSLKEKAMRTKMDVKAAVEEKGKGIKEKRIQSRVTKIENQKTKDIKSGKRMYFQEKKENKKDK